VSAIQPEGKIAIITVGGIGKAIAFMLAGEGADVVVAVIKDS
jgi:NAD(P)-dependent dehydrogenase (short-subunit alcohol dehydrogenase family)